MCRVLLGSVCCAGEKASQDDQMTTLRSKYDEAVKERDELQRAYAHARQEVDILLHSLQDMKASRDQAVANYQNVIRAPAASVGITGSVKDD